MQGNNNKKVKTNARRSLLETLKLKEIKRGLVKLSTVQRLRGTSQIIHNVQARYNLNTVIRESKKNIPFRSHLINY